MNEEIGRVLDLLEAGKIGADEAERLIRAVCEAARPGGARQRDRSVARDDLRAACRWIGKRCREMARTRHTVRWWHHFAHRRYREEERARRASRLSACERVTYVLDAYLLRDSAPREARLREDLGLRGLEWELLRYALEDEFRLEIFPGDLKACVTVADIVALVGSSHNAAEPAAEATSPQEATPPEGEPSAEGGGAPPVPRRSRGARREQAE